MKTEITEKGILLSPQTDLEKDLFRSHFDNANTPTKFKAEPTVYDRETGLIWQQSGSDNTMTFPEAKKYIKKLNQYRFADYSDWRLPNLEEAKSLIQPIKNEFGLFIDPIFCKDQEWIWTSKEDSSGLAWLVVFTFGNVLNLSQSDVNYVRAVRSR